MSRDLGIRERCKFSLRIMELLQLAGRVHISLSPKDGEYPLTVWSDEQVGMETPPEGREDLADFCTGVHPYTWGERGEDLQVDDLENAIEALRKEWDQDDEMPQC